MSLYADGSTYRQWLVHRLVCLTFHGPPPEPLAQARHLDGNQKNNRADNLAWGSASENTRDQVRHGTHNAARKTHCPKGHEYTPENTTLTATRQRKCRQCKREYDAARRPGRSVATRQVSVPRGSVFAKVTGPTTAVAAVLLASPLDGVTRRTLRLATGLTQQSLYAVTSRMLAAGWLRERNDRIPALYQVTAAGERGLAEYSQRAERQEQFSLGLKYHPSAVALVTLKSHPAYLRAAKTRPRKQSPQNH